MLPLPGAGLADQYRVVRLLGKGATGEVYLVEHRALGRLEALKVLRDAFASDPRFVARFRREARAINRVRHPSIVGLYDYGQLPDGRLFLSMEYAEGETLAQLLGSQHAQPLPRALGILTQLADALAHAHGCGVIHRDLKPANLILTGDKAGRELVKILDFGMAKIVAPDGKDSLVVSVQGEVSGTPQYMAPEMLAGSRANLDPRSDVYAIGCIGYELLVGEPPFSGRLMEVMSGHLYQEPVPPSVRRPDLRLPPPIDALLLRCLAKQPDGRPAASELKLALSQHAGPPARPRRFTTMSARRSDFDDEATATDALAAPAPAGEEPDLGAERSEVTLVLQELAELLPDVGCRDVALLVGLARLEALDQERAEAEAERASLEDQLATVERTASERIAGMRFALGELTFERARPDLDAEARRGLTDQIAELEQRLRDMATRAAARAEQLGERGIELAAGSAVRDEAIDVLLRELVEVGVRLAAQHPDPRMAGFDERLRLGLARLVAGLAGDPVP